MATRGWNMREVFAMSVVNPRATVRVEGPPELLEQLVQAFENGYWECPDGHCRPCHSKEYADAKVNGPPAEYMPELCGVGGCMKECGYVPPQEES